MDSDSVHHAPDREVTSMDKPLVCGKCFRAKVRESLLCEMKAEVEKRRKAATPRADDGKTKRESETIKAKTIHLMSRINHLTEMIDMRKSDLSRKKADVEAMKADVDHLQRIVRSFVSERIRVRYCLSSMISLERIRFTLCPDCVLGMDNPKGVNRSGSSDGLTRTSNMPESRSCGRCSCM